MRTRLNLTWIRSFTVSWNFYDSKIVTVTQQFKGENIVLRQVKKEEQRLIACWVIVTWTRKIVTLLATLVTVNDRRPDAQRRRHYNARAFKMILSCFQLKAHTHTHTRKHLYNKVATGQLRYRLSNARFPSNEANPRVYMIQFFNGHLSLTKMGANKRLLHLNLINYSCVFSFSFIFNNQILINYSYTCNLKINLFSLILFCFSVFAKHCIIATSKKGKKWKNLLKNKIILLGSQSLIHSSSDKSEEYATLLHNICKHY